MPQHSFLEASSCDVSNCYDISFVIMTDTFLLNDWETSELLSQALEPGRCCVSATFFQYSL